MKYKFNSLIFVFFFGTLFTLGQNGKSEKQLRREAAKVDTVYTVEERARMGRWLYDRVNEMGLSDTVREQYDAIVFSHIFDMTRLNDKDKDYTDAEIQIKFDEIVDKMNLEVKAILTTEQYINHLENFAEIERSVYKKFNWREN
ncbi:hypothetical protein C1T31_09995 [Hanstruepera neustonica]|uniref:Uncharacterized protein n=1 Tax=Hanstruepera neustonica TaxID=1445657 RepID=A0A2K1DXU5_9FLAO|nr:hypothetical protein [Hanstruepera neustonica]PNQ72830.1 hypothetical protein C1T31_09995 [Hanstruepera neustonica]